MKYLSFLLLLGAVSAYAGENLPGNVPGPNYTSARGAAMGDAFLPLADDDASALFYNPASLNKIRSTGFEPFDISLYGNNGYLSGLSSSNVTKITSLSGNQPTLQANPGSFAGGGMQIFPSFFTRGFAFGVLLKSDVGAVSNSGGSITYKSLYQLIPTVGGGVRLAGGIVKLGYSLQWVNEAAGSDTVNPSALPASCPTLGYNQCLAQGSAFSNNVGMTVTMPWQYLPAMSIVARNIGGEHFGTSSLYHFSPTPTGTLPYQPMSVDAAFSMQPRIGSGSYVNLVGQLNDMTDTSGMGIMGRWAAGAEMSVRNVFFLRGGWGQGYPSAGFGVRQRHGEIDFTWYSEELSDTYHGQRDQRYMFQYVVRAF